MGQLSDRVALVTGGGSGIGRETCRLFTEEGAVVVVNDVDQASAELTRKEMSPAAAGMAIAADVSRADAVAEMFARIEEAYGRLDVLVTCAAIPDAHPDGMQQLYGMLETRMAELGSGHGVTTHIDSVRDMPDEVWHRVIDVNLHGTFYCIRAALRPMSRQNSGSIICLSSVAGMTGGVAGNVHYSASKAGILGLVKGTALEVGSRNIRVNAVCPSAADTPMHGAMSPVLRTIMETSTPLGRMATAREVATTCLFLASDDSSFYTGQALSPNGGYFTG
jgi:3-oxoacyl-[acyl-carrier protein] reductase